MKRVLGGADAFGAELERASAHALRPNRSESKRASVRLKFQASLPPLKGEGRRRRSVEDGVDPLSGLRS